MALQTLYGHAEVLADAAVGFFKGLVGLARENGLAPILKAWSDLARAQDRPQNITSKAERQLIDFSSKLERQREARKQARKKRAQKAAAAQASAHAKESHSPHASPTTSSLPVVSMAQPRSEASTAMLSAGPIVSACPTAPACPVACPPCPTIASMSLEPTPTIPYVSATHSGSEEQATFTSTEPTVQFDHAFLQAVKHRVAAQLEYNGLFILSLLLYILYRSKQQTRTSTPTPARPEISLSSETDITVPSSNEVPANSGDVLATVLAGGLPSVTADNTIAAEWVQSTRSLSRPGRGTISSSSSSAASPLPVFARVSGSRSTRSTDGTPQRKLQKRPATVGNVKASGLSPAASSTPAVTVPLRAAADSSCHDDAPLRCVRESVDIIERSRTASGTSSSGEPRASL
ncbi:hypothetical protein PLICRDRAFT_660738 [Plicaturopsis crispa FD-325 SS-3]|nr:hypothetical protein PLICRDRAFT_660738 [Plicaturopsis crispa FD-325 SS-3]